MCVAKHACSGCVSCKGLHCQASAVAVLCAQWLEFPTGIRSFDEFKQVVLLRSAIAARAKEPKLLIYGSREEAANVWRRGPRITIEDVQAITLTGDRVSRLYTGPPELEVQCDEDVHAMPSGTVVRVFGVWGPADTAPSRHSAPKPLPASATK